MFNELMKVALETGIYICPECGEEMVFDDDDKTTLVCENCGYSMDLEHYGYSDEEYADLYS